MTEHLLAQLASASCILRLICTILTAHLRRQNGRLIKQQYGGSRSDLRIIGNDVYVVGKHNKYGEFIGTLDELIDIFGGQK